MSQKRTEFSSIQSRQLCHETTTSDTPSKISQKHCPQDPAPNPPAENTPRPNNTSEENPNKDGVSTNPKGDFKTQRFTLKHSKKPRKFGCKMCDKVCDSIHELSLHHQQSHNISYCDVCTKAFNNPALLAHHKYVHQEAKFQCEDCDQ